MNLKTLVLCGLTSLALITAGCEDDRDSSNPNPSTEKESGRPSTGSNNSGWGLKKYSPTDVNPEEGRYTFSAAGSFNVQTNSSGGQIRFSRDGYAYYSVPIKNGVFYYRNGCLVNSSDRSDSGKLYPTDGFAISGHFTSSNAAEGSIAYSYSGRATDGPKSFTAAK